MASVKAIIFYLTLWILPYFSDAVIYQMDTSAHETATKQGFSDAMALINIVLTKGNAFGNDPDTDRFARLTFNRYFPDTDAARTRVRRVFTDIHDKGLLGENGGPPFFDSYTIQDMNTAIGDTNGRCLATSNEAQGYQTVAYTQSGKGNGINWAITVFCPTGGVYNGPAWSFKSQAQSADCTAAGSQMQGAMASFGSIIVHELMHWGGLASYSPPAINFAIKDLSYQIGPGQPVKVAYGPFNVVEANTKGEGIDTTKNADNYRWFAIEHFYNVLCPSQRPFAAPIDNTDGGCKDTGNGCSVQ